MDQKPATDYRAHCRESSFKLQTKETQLRASEPPQPASGKGLNYCNPNELISLLEFLAKVKLILIPGAKSCTTYIGELINDEPFVLWISVAQYSRPRFSFPHSDDR